MDHSVRGYLERRPTWEFLGMLKYYSVLKEYNYAVPLIREILSERKKEEQKKAPEENQNEP